MQLLSVGDAGGGVSARSRVAIVPVRPILHPIDRRFHIPVVAIGIKARLSMLGGAGGGVLGGLRSMRVRGYPRTMNKIHELI